MTAQTGRTHAKHITVKLDDAAGTLTDITPYVNSIGQIGLEYETEDVTAFSDGVRNVVIGQPTAPIVIGGPFDTTMHAQAIAINGDADEILSFDCQIGIRHAWEAGEPQFGITQATGSGYVMHSYKTDGMTWEAQLDVYGSTAPAWGTAAEV